LQLLELSKTEAHKKLFEGQYDLAIPAALQALRFSMDVFGQNRLRQYSQAEDYLSLAKWAVLKVDSCDNKIRSQMHRNFGLLYASQGNYEESLMQLAQDIYYSSLDKGPDHISVSGGYFQLGNVFHKQGRLDHVIAVFDKVVAIWKTAVKSNDEMLDEAQQAEAIQMLTTIYSFRVSYIPAPTSAAEVNFVLGQLYHAYGHLDRAREYATKALEVYETALGREHSLTIDARNFFKSVVGEIQQSTRVAGGGGGGGGAAMAAGRRVSAAGPLVKQ
ncbi:Zinc finger MYND domain-containing protein 12, partial [Chytridiales sp. JEL 0842]